MDFSSAFLRMPTPPREDVAELTTSVDEAIRFLDTSLTSPLKGQTTSHTSTAQSSLYTPPSSSPIQSLAERDHRGHKRARRLRFSAETSLCDAEVKPLPPPKSQNPTKSILKPSEPLPPPSSTAAIASSFPAAHKFGDFGTMLDSVLKELAGHDHTSQHDAYLTLWRSIKAHQDFPGSDALLEKLPLLEQFVKRDIGSVRNTASKNKLKVQALQLASTLIWKLPPALNERFLGSRGVSNEFVSLLVKQAIHVLEDRATPKELLRHQLLILTMPEVHSSKSINTERASKLLESLGSAHERFSGNSIIQLRLMICRQIVQYHSSVVVAEINGILAYVLHGLCSSDKETRARAIELGLVLGTHVGNRKRVSLALRDKMQSDASGHGPYVAHFERRLTELMKSEECSQHAPQIWGLIMLMLRGEQTLLRQWLSRQSWLKVIEFCFNSSDTNLNLHAWAAWNRTIYAARLLMIEQELVLKRLCQPIFGNLHRKSNCESTFAVKNAAFASYYLILYYAFGQEPRPGKRQYCWERLIGEMSRKMPGIRAGDGLRFAQALCALFADSSLKIWNSERGLQTFKNPVKWEEIPRLDPIWIRKHISLILDTVEPLLRDLLSPISTPFSNDVWTSLMKAISQAGEKEIKASSEFRAALATIVNYLEHFSSAKKNLHDNDQDSRAAQIEAFLRLVHSSVKILGAMHWGEEFLRLAHDGTIEAGSTPSKTGLQSPASGQLRSPIASVLGLLCKPPPHSVLSPTARSDLTSVLTACLETKPNCGLKVDLIYTCVRSLTFPEDSSSRHTIVHIWQILSHLTSSAIKSVPSYLENAGIDCGHYQKLLHILHYGLYFSDLKSLDLGRALFQNIGLLARKEAGNAGFLVAVAEPWLDILTKTDSTYNSSATIMYLSYILDQDLPIPSAKAIEHARIAINKTQHTFARPGSDGWLESLLPVVCQGLSCCYAKLEALDFSAVDNFLCSARKFLDRSKDRPLGYNPFGEFLVCGLHSGLFPWIQDQESKVVKSRSRGYNIEQSFGQLWECFLDFIARVPSADNRLASPLESLLIVGLRSRNKKFANLTITSWNRISENQDAPECSETLRTVLTRLQAYTDVRIPSPNRQNDAAIDDTDIPREDEKLFDWLNDETSQGLSHSSNDCPPVLHVSVSTYRTARGTVLSRPSKISTPTKAVRKGTPPPRVRHDDSQIQFVAIDSSPIGRPSYTDDEILTEHQKDVRSRQVADINLFPNLRSSPIANLPANEERLSVGEADAQMAVNELDRMENCLETCEPRLMPLLHNETPKSDQDFIPEQPIESFATDAETFVDAASAIESVVIENALITSHSEAASFDQSDSAAPAISNPQDGLRIATSCVQKLDLGVSEDAQLSKDIENVEESFKERIWTLRSPPKDVQPGIWQLSCGAILPQDTKAIVEGNEISEIFVAPDNTSSEKDRKPPQTPVDSDEDKRTEPNCGGTQSQAAQKADSDTEGDVIVVEDPDDSSPPFKVVLESLGIIVPSASKSPSSQTSSRKGRAPQSKRKREISANDENGENSTKRRRRSKQSNSQQSASHGTPRRQPNNGAEMRTHALFKQLKDIMGAVKELEREALDKSARLKLIKLGAQLQRQIEATAGD